MRHLTFQREGEREASGPFTVDLWLYGIFGVYLPDTLFDLHTREGERGARGPSQSVDLWLSCVSC